MTDILNILDQVQAKAALQSTLAAAGAANALAMEREQAASREHDRLSAHLHEVRATIARHQRSPGPAFVDDEDLTEREAELARDLEAVEQAMADAATQAATARSTIKVGMSDWLAPIQVNKATIAAHLDAIAAAGAEVARIDDAITHHAQTAAVHRDEIAAASRRHQEDLAKFLAGQALGDIPADAPFEPPPAAPESPQAALDAATQAGLAIRRGEALAALETLRGALPAVRAAVLVTDLEAVLREHTGAATKEHKLRTRANALRSLLDGFEVHKPDFVPAPLAQPPAAGVNHERDRLSGLWPGLWATRPH
ncbi:MAG: hypothetical protein KAX46_09595 [Chromatiaceae bacterium]|nr:hypothetical protein [Chromatiaceae bacterium]